MKSFKSIISLIVAILMLSGMFIIAFPASAATNDGIQFLSTDLYKAQKTLSETPNTFEAWIKMPKNASNSRGGVIIGNYGMGYSVVNVEIHNSGRPRLYWTDAKGKNTDIIFSEINVCTGEWTHLTIVRNTAEGKVDCYINGNLKQSITIDATAPINDIIPISGLCIGGDFRDSNAQYFKGSVKEVAIFSTVRSQSEIQSDMTSITDKNGLLAHYDLTAQEARTDISDLSGSGCDIKYTHNIVWIAPKDKEAVTDYAYSFAVVGDTQILNYKFPDKFHVIYDWIIDNIESKKIKYVFGLGDITDKTLKEEWERAKESIYALDGKVDYSVVRGNHDNLTMFKEAFPWSKYKDTFNGSFDGTMLNTYRTLTIGKVKYLMITLDYGASNQVLRWAGEICDQYPDHNVIITTHCYLFRDGTTLDAGDICPPASSGGQNNGDHMWDKLVSQHENIVLVISGHDPCAQVIVSNDVGKHGNTVTQMLVDPQGLDSGNNGLGMVAMLYFSEDGRDVTLEYYSTIKEQFYQTINQFSFTLDLVDQEESEQTTSEEIPTELPTTEIPSVEGSTNESPTAETDSSNTSDSGCSSTLSLGVGTITTLVCCMAVVTTNKKKY